MKNSSSSSNINTNTNLNNLPLISGNSLMYK